MIYNNYDEPTSTMTDSTCAEVTSSKNFVDYVKELSRTWTGFKDPNPFDWEFNADEKISYVPYTPGEFYYSSAYKYYNGQSLPSGFAQLFSSNDDTPYQRATAQLERTQGNIPQENLDACADDIGILFDGFK